MKRLFILILPLLLVVSCKDNSTGKQVVKTDYPLDTLLKITAQSDSSQSYWLYLPPNYNDNGTFPVVWLFDAHGNGHKITKAFMPAARKYGFVLAGSNNFRNNVKDLNHILDVLFSDLNSGIHINASQQYTGGFSGGARVAAMLTMNGRSFKGTAMLSAGLSQGMQVINNDFCLITYAGTRDFNYNEITRATPLEAQKLGIPYQIIVFRGKHEYPPQDLLQESLLWFKLNMIKRGEAPKNKKLVKQTVMYFDSLAKAQNNIYDKYTVLKREKAFLDGLTKTNNIDKQIQEIEQSREFKNHIAKLQKISALEAKLQQGYYMAIQDKDAKWWENEINVINEKIKTEKDPDYKDLYYRIENFISIMAYSQVNHALMAGDLASAAKYLTIYKAVDPHNPDVYTFEACYYAKQKQYDKAKEAFAKAVENGFFDRSQLKRKCFDPIRQDLIKMAEKDRNN